MHMLMNNVNYRPCVVDRVMVRIAFGVHPRPEDALAKRRRSVVILLQIEDTNIDDTMMHSHV